MNKKYYFLSGLPRSGNTVLSSILIQNPEIKVSPNSFLSTIFCQILDQDNNPAFHNFPEYQSLKDCASSLFESYYKSWKANIIIDRSPWGTDGNLKILKDYCPNKPKFICPTRNILEVLSSFIILYNKNKIIDINDKKEVEKTCYNLLSEGGFIFKSISSINNLSKGNYDVYFMKYDEFCQDPQMEIKKIYEFLNIKSFSHYFKDIKQFEINGVKYQDDIHQSYINLHKVKPIISKNKFDVSDVLPQNIIRQYCYLNFDNL